jgi:hypothetical protein
LGLLVNSIEFSWFGSCWLSPQWIYPVYGGAG